MSIYLGDLTITQFEKRCGIELMEEQRATLSSLIEHNCSKVKGNNKIHIFDIPFCIECGNPETRKTVIDILTPLSSQIKETLQVGGGVS